MISERVCNIDKETNMQTNNRRAAIVAAALLTATMGAVPAFASPIMITDGWIRALPGNLPAGGYFTLHNGSAKAITLTGAESAACGMLMLHKSEEMSGMSSMSDVESIDIPAGSTVKFAPGGYHLMCMNPVLKQDTTVTVTLQFAGGARIAAPFAVRSATGK